MSETEQDKDKENREAHEELVNSYYAQLRSDVMLALKEKHGIDEPDPHLLEETLWFQSESYFDRKGTVSKKLISNIKKAIEDSVPVISEQPEQARSTFIYAIFMVFRNLAFNRNFLKRPPFTEWQIENQPDPKTFTDLLEQGEDPRRVALIILNIYGSREDFTQLSSVLGNDILSWDNKRSLAYQDYKANKPENRSLSDDMRIEPVGLVAIEPFIDFDHDSHYDLYGAYIANVTSFSINFVPKEGVDSRHLQRHVEHAIDRFIKEGQFTFQPPRSYKKPHNAYKRPEKYKGSEFFNDAEMDSYWDSFLSHWKTMNEDLVKKHWDLFYYMDDEKKEVYDTGFISGYQINRWVLSNKFVIQYGAVETREVPQKLIDDIKAAAKSAQNFHHTTVNDEGHVVLNNTLILDDVLQLYEFCDWFLTPSVQIAQALEAARYAEECGPLQSPGDLDDDFSKDHLRLTDQLGNFDGVDPEHIVDKALHDIMAFYGRGGDAQMAFLQAASLAHGTLIGALPDGTGQFPTLKQITDASQSASSSDLVVVAEESLTERTGLLLRRAVTLFGEPNSELPLKEQFAEASEAMSELLRYQQRIEDICNHYKRELRYGFRALAKTSRNMIDELLDQPEAIDLLSKERSHAMFCLSAHKSYEPQYDPLDIINALEGRVDNDSYWIEQGNDEELDTNQQFTEDTVMPDNLDTLGGYIWRCCKEQIFKKYTEKEHTFLPYVRANIDLHGGETPPQLPRDFDGTAYITRPEGTPFPRPNTDLPDELAELLPKKERTRPEHAQLPDPSVIWGQTDKPSP